jgi:hypothetical protein
MVSARSICQEHLPIRCCGFAQRRASAVGAGCRGEVAALLSIRADKLTDDARQRLLRHGAFDGAADHDRWRLVARACVTVSAKGVERGVLGEFIRKTRDWAFQMTMGTSKNSSRQVLHESDSVIARPMGG